MQITGGVHAHLARAPLPALFEAAHRQILAELHERLAAQGFEDIRPAHSCVFRFVDHEGTRLTELALRAELTKQAVGEFVDELERVGYVERVPDPKDRRAKIIRPTKHGQAAIEAAQAIFADIEKRWAKEYGARRVADMREILERAVFGAAAREAA
jgi:DNA-binding MarR family transcriptional regulator